MNKAIKTLIDSEEISTTDNPLQAIYLLADGTMISGEFVDGCRCQDHRCLEALTDCKRGDSDFWPEIFRKAGYPVMLEPETCTMYYMRDGFTHEQAETVCMLQRSGYVLERFS